ncbi:MAG: hypothetical protein AAFP97_10205 [Pseudomonadota bacterium]
MTIKVDLRVVGIFFHTEVTLAGDGPFTVEDALVEAKNNSTVSKSFDFVRRSPGQPKAPTNFSATYTNPVDSKASGNRYSAGHYSLSDSWDQDADFYRIWQYYIQKPNNMIAPADGEFVPAERAIIEDGDTIIWRLVTIHVDAVTGRPGPNPDLVDLMG